MGGNEFAEAVADLIRSTGLTVHLDLVPDDPRYPYVALYFDGGRGSDVSLAARQELTRFYPRLTCVGVDASQVRRVRDRARSVIGQTVTAGGLMARVLVAASIPVQRDDSLPDRVVLFAVDTLKIDAYAQFTTS